MIELRFKDSIDKTIEKFKVSKKSICHNCEKYSNKCEHKEDFVCGTDSSIGLAYIEKCPGFKSNE